MDPPLSKSAQKKAARAARYAEYKIQRRAREKEARKEKKRIRAEKRAAGQLDDDGDDDNDGRQKKRPRVQFGGTVVVDLGFDDLMSEKEVASLCSQLAYTYSANRSASYPFSLLFTSINGRTLERLESQNCAGYKRWSKTEWWPDGYERLWEDVGNGKEQADRPNTLPISSKQNVIYLTADSEEELSELRPDETYIIGGIVDHNRYKNLCQNKANKSHIRTARLPIGRYLANLPTRKVLTVNQVFEILVKWVETKDWEVALNSVMPKRKFLAEGRHGKSKDNTTAGGEEDEEQCDGSGEGVMEGAEEENMNEAHRTEESIQRRDDNRDNDMLAGTESRADDD